MVTIAGRRLFGPHLDWGGYDRHGLVTGVSGFIGGHIAAGLLRRGYAVRGSVRSPARAAEVRAAMAAAGADDTLLEVRQLDLLSDEGWVAATAGCRFVLHVASPFVTTKPKDPQDLIRPAVQGTTRAISAALDAGVERVVVTSALATVQFAPARRDHVLTASDWTRLDRRGLSAYVVSKVRAERAAWSADSSEAGLEATAGAGALLFASRRDRGQVNGAVPGDRRARRVQGSELGGGQGDRQRAEVLLDA
jgi:dihydroflavonol-4-reductase